MHQSKTTKNVSVSWSQESEDIQYEAFRARRFMYGAVSLNIKI